MAHSTVLLGSPFMHKNGDLNVMAVCVFCMLLVWAIAAHVRCGNSVRDRNRHQETAPRQCRAVASRWSTSRTCRSPCACSSLSCDPVGRLEPMPDATRVDDSTTHTNRHHHRPACRVLCRDGPKTSAHAATTGALAAQLGRATGTQCPSQDCSRCGDHPVRSAFALCYFPGSVDPLRTCARISRSVGTSRFPGTRSACLADGPGSSACSSTKPAALSVLR
jgi:hypothetical protein